MAAAVALAPSVAAAGGKRTARDVRCDSRDAVTLLASEEARLFRVREFPGFRWACATGRRRPLWLLQRPVGEDADVAVTGRYVTFTSRDEGCSSGQCVGPVSYIVNVRSRRERRLAATAAISMRADGTYAAVQIQPTDDIRRPIRRIVFVTETGTRVLDESPDIDSTSLVSRGRRLYWVDAGVAQTAVI